MKTFSDIVKAFGGPGAFAAVIKKPLATVNSMTRRGSIDVKHWKAIEAAAKVQSLDIDRYVLVDVALNAMPDEAPPRAPNPPKPGAPRRAERATAE